MRNEAILIKAARHEQYCTYRSIRNNFRKLNRDMKQGYIRGLIQAKKAMKEEFEEHDINSFAFLVHLIYFALNFINISEISQFFLFMTV